MSQKDALVIDRVETGLRLMLDGIKQLRAADDWVDQDHSPLGKRAHLAAVRRGDLVGHRVPGSRAVLVMRDAIDRYIAAHRVKASEVPAEEADDTRDEHEIAAEALAHRAPPKRRTKKEKAA